MKTCHAPLLVLLAVCCTWRPCARRARPIAAMISPASLKSQIDGLSIGRTAANVIFLSHPAAKQMRLGCPAAASANDIYAASDSRKPTPAFYDLVANAAAIVFTIPKPDTLRGAQRCIGRMGLFRGDDVKTRYRRLDMHCTRSKTGAPSRSRAAGPSSRRIVQPGAVVHASHRSGHFTRTRMTTDLPRAALQGVAWCSACREIPAGQHNSFAF